MAHQLVLLLSLVLFHCILTSIPTKFYIAQSVKAVRTSNASDTDSYSPPVTSSTAGILTNNDFTNGGDGGGPSECDGKYHSNDDNIVALSTGWYNGGSLCGHTIIIAASNGRTATATVVDECDVPRDGCRNNVVDGSNAVWNALGLDVSVGVVDITWSIA